MIGVPPTAYSLLLCAVLHSTNAISNSVISHQSELEGGVDTVIDVRPLASCKSGTLAEARCIPVEDLVTPGRRLANVSGLLWLLGSAGLSGDEHVLVIGDDSSRRDFMAGVLYVAGQSRISVLNTRVTGTRAYQKKPGILRSMTREQVYRAPMRSNKVVLRGELESMINHEPTPVLLDGRSENEYWGVRVRGTRGGHLPGAQHLNSTGLRAGHSDSVNISREAGDPIAYSHDAFEGLVYLARLVASRIDARLYLEGLVGWASDGSLPMDSTSYPQYENSARNQRSETTRNADGTLFSPAAVIAGGGFAMAGFLVGRLTKNKGSG
ncbi:MAG: hypothetical protein GY703_14165 [Gammaproteobacteria bacterium]|nr:hypothetical protein [Gammaproteobacteria bacterium]